MALAGGVVDHASRSGAATSTQEGGILSPDGHCRAFDAAAPGHGRRQRRGRGGAQALDDALADGDTIHAVIRGSAVNNDGAAQGRLHRAQRRRPGRGDRRGALPSPGSTRTTIGYVEAHGTGTPLGDPIEVAALTQAFRAGTDADGLLRVGSVKTQHRPPGRGRRRGRADQDGAGAASTGRSRRASTSSSPTRRSTSRTARSSSTRALRDWQRGRRAAPRRRQLVRHRRHQRPRGPGRGAAAPRAVRAPPAPGSCCCSRRETARGARSRHGRTWPTHLRAAPGGCTWPTWPTRSRSAGAPFAHRRARRAAETREDAVARPCRRATPAGLRPALAEPGEPPGGVPVPGPGRAVRGHGRGTLPRPSRSSASRSTAARELLAPAPGAATCATCSTRPEARREEAARAARRRPRSPSRRCSRRVRAGAAVDELGRAARRR